MRWFRVGRDARLRLINIGHMLTGNAANIALGIPAIILTARALGPQSYGILALVLTYVQVIKRISDFQIWQPLIRFGANISAKDDRVSLMALLKYGFLLDLCCSIVSWLFAIVGTAAATRFFDADAPAAWAMMVYATILLFNANGSSVAVLRLAKRYRITAYVQPVISGLKVGLCAIAYMADAGLLTFVSIWALADSLAPLLITRAAWHELKHQGLQSFYRAELQGLFERFPGLWRFTWSSNLSLTLWSSTQMLDTLLVGWLTDPASAGLYYFAKRIARLGQQASAQVQAVVYPDIARLWAAGKLDAFRRVVIQTETIVAGFGILLVVASATFGATIIGLTAGPAFKAAAPLLVVQTIALTLTMSGTVMRSALLSMERAGSVLKVVVASTIAFHVTALVLLPAIGPMGANLAHITLGLIWLGGLAAAFRRAVAQQTRTASPVAA